MTNKVQFDTEGLEDYMVSEELLKNGVWLDFPNGRRFRVKRAHGSSNRPFARRITAAMKPYRRRGVQNMDPDIAQKIMLDAYAHTVIVDWQGIHDIDGDDVPCTPENVIAFFTAFPELFNDVAELASELSIFVESQIEEAENILGED